MNINGSASSEAKTVNRTITKTKHAGALRALLACLVFCFLITARQVCASEDGSGSYGREHCNSNEGALYDAIYDAVRAYTESSVFAGDLNTDTGVIKIENSLPQITKSAASYVVHCFLNDHPELYWLSGGYTYWLMPDGTVSGVDLKVDADYYLRSARLAADEAIAAKTAEWSAELSAISGENALKTREYLVALRLHDLLVGEVDYRFDDGVPSSKRSAHSIVGILDGTGVVCEGYARAFQYFLNLQNIDNIYVVGTASGGGHAWNILKLGEEYFCVDITWDDLNGAEKEREFCRGIYDYFCMPVQDFSEDHTPESRPYCYTLPTLSNSDKYVFYKVFDSYTSEELTEENKSSFINAGLNGIYRDAVYYVVRDTSSYALLKRTLSEGLNPLTYYGAYGFMLVMPAYTVTNPATSITLKVKNGEWGDPVPTEEETAPELQNLPVCRLEVGDTVTLQAVLTSLNGSSDDRVSWTIEEGRGISLSPSDTECTLTATRNGTIIIRARAYGGVQQSERISAFCRIIVGNGRNNPLYTIWAGGDRTHKTVEIKPSVKASGYKDRNGKIKTGKLVWLVKNEETEISFNEDKHTVTTKSDKAAVTVSKGKVTAKSAGTAYVYCIDTGSFDYECYEIKVLQSTVKFGLAANAGAASKSDFLRNPVIYVGNTACVYIIPDIKNGTAAKENTYRVQLAKASDSKYLEVSEVYYDENGVAYFIIKGINSDPVKKKAVKPKLVITNVESGKKQSLTITVANPVSGIECTFSGAKLEKKKDTITIKITLKDLGEKGYTTDALKLYIAGDNISVENDRKIVKEGKTTVKAKLDAKTLTVTLTASKDLDGPAVVALACTERSARVTELYEICRITEKGDIIPR